MPGARILTLPFAYNVELVRPRHRRPETMAVRDDVPVRVAVASGEEAPEAFVLHWPSSDLPLPTRAYGGRLYRQVGHGARTPVTPDRFEADVNLPAKGWGAFGFLAPDPGRPSWQTDDYPRLPLLKGRDFGRRAPMTLPTLEELAQDVTEGASRLRTRSNDRTARRAEAQEILSEGLVIVEGGVWSDAYGHEPYWGVAAGRVTFRTEADPPWYLVPFRLDRFAEAVAYASGPSGGVDVSDLPRVEVPRPDLLRLDEVVMLGRQALSGLGASVSERSEWDAVAAARYARALGARPVKGLAEAVGVLEDLRCVAEELAARPAERYQDGARFLERTAPALARWEQVREERPDLAGLIAAGEEDDLSLASLAP